MDLELVVPEDGDLVVPSSGLSPLAARPGDRVWVHIEKQPSRRSLMGALRGSTTRRLTIEDFDSLSRQVWRGTGYASA